MGSLPHGIGSDGIYENNCWRDLQRLLGATKLPTPFTWQLPVVHSILGYLYRPASMIMPHELFSSIYHNFPQMFRKCIFTGVGRCKQFWLSVRSGAHFNSHPVRFRENFMSLCCPLRFHGDGTPCVAIGKGWSKMMDCYSLASLLAYGPTLIHHYMIFAIHQALLCRQHGHHTMNSFFRKLKWSMDACWSGYHPMEDAFGKPSTHPMKGEKICGGIFFCIWACIGDLDYFRTLDLPNSNSNSPCAFCPCDSGLGC